MQTVYTLIRRRVLRRLIWVCTVCQCPIYGTLGTNLSPDSIFSVIFSFLFKGIQSSTAYNDLISYAP